MAICEHTFFFQHFLQFWAVRNIDIFLIDGIMLYICLFSELLLLCQIQ